MFHLEPDPYIIEKDDNGFFPSLKQANQDPLFKVYEECEHNLSKLQEHYSHQPPFPHDNIRVIKSQQEKYELKKLLNNNLEKITLPSDRPHYGPGALVPNSVLVRNRTVARNFLMGVPGHPFGYAPGKKWDNSYESSYSFRRNYFGQIDNQENKNRKNGYHLFYLKNKCKH